MKKDLEGKLAVVTGAASGIGFCFCKELAARGCGLVMIDISHQLEEKASELKEEHGVETYPLCCNLTTEKCDEKIHLFLAAKELEPDYLINNAGIFNFKPVAETPDFRIDCFIDLHVRAVTKLSKMFGTRFMKRGYGRILNMSSMSCWMPMPGIAMYSATKAYIRVFSRALYYEMKDSGATVTVACPGGIATDLFGLPENLKRLAVRIGALQTPEKFVHKAVNKMLKGKKQYINGWLNRISIVMVGLMPTPVRMLIKRKMLDRNIVR